MAPFNINAVTFIPGKEFNFIAGTDGRLHVSDPEMARSSQIGPDSNSCNTTRSSFESNSVRLERRIAPPRYLFGFSNSTNVYQHMLRQIMELRSGWDTYSGEEQGRVDDAIHLADDE